MSQTPAFQRCDGQNNIVIVPTVSFSKNVPTPPPVYVQKKNALKVQSGQNILGDLTDTASTMSQPKSTHLIEDQSDVMCSIEYQLEQLMPTSLEHQTKPSQTSSNEDVNKNFANVEDFNKTKKVNSWASSYLQSIGHNNLKPRKINLSLSKNENRTAKNISTKTNKSNETVAQPTFLKGTTSSFNINEGINMTRSPPEFIKPNEQKISEHKYVGSIETLHPDNVNVCGSHTNEQSEVHSNMILPMCQNITSTSVTSNIMLDTSYSNNHINKAPAYATLLAKGIGEATYCYNDGKREIDIYDAIKSKINHEFAIEQKQNSTMNLPTHKKMCEDFIKEISNNKASKSGRKKQSTTKTETKLKILVKKDKNQQNSQSSKETKRQTSDKERVKNSKSSLKNYKPEKKDKKLDKECQLKEKQQNLKPIIDLKDFGSKHIFYKETETEHKSQSVDRQKLKRVRAISEDLHNSSSGIRTHTPIRSVEHVNENCQSKPKRQCLDEHFDLRSKLSRVNERIYKKTHMQRDTQSMNKIPKSRENLKITVEHQTNEKQKSPKKSGVLKKSKKCKKLKLIINVVCAGSDDETTSSDSTYSETENNPTHNMDLSFLDDFNVDEIVDCLKHSPKQKIKSLLPSDSKMEDNTKRPEPELKFSTILNMLGAKSTETNKFKNPVRTDFTTEETIKIASSTRSNDLNNPSLATDVKTSSLKSEENANNEKHLTTHALVLFSETKLQLDQKKTASWEEGYPNAKCGIKAEDVTNKTQNHEQANEENEKIIRDESVLIVDPGISIIDLTDETVVDASATNNIAVFVKPNHSEKPNNENKKPIVKSVEFNHIENNLKSAPNTHRNTNKEKEKSKSETINRQQMDVDADLKIPILAKNEKIFIDLTNDSVDDEIKSNLSINTSVDVKCKLVTETPSKNKVGKQKDARTETISANEILKQPDIQLIPLPNEYAVRSTENKKTIETKTLKDTNNYTNRNYKNTNESKSKVIENASPTYKRNGSFKNKEKICANNLNKKIFDTIPVKIVVNNEIGHNETNTKIVKEKPEKSLIKNEMTLGNRVTKDNASKANKKTSKVFETKSAKRLIKNIVESVWGGSKDNPENTSKTNNGAKKKPDNAPKNKCKVKNGTQNELENTSKNSTGIKSEPAKPTKINISTKNKPENITKIIKGTKNEPEILSITTNVTTNQIANTKTNNSTNNTPKNKCEIISGDKKEPIFFSKIYNSTKNAPKITSKNNNVTKNELENTSEINSGTKNKPENAKTNNSTNNKAENTSKINGGTKNKPEFTKTNNGTNNESKMNRGTSNKPENTFKSSNGTTCEPENTSKPNSDPKNKTENTKTNNSTKNISKINSGTNNKTENTKTNNESKINRGTVNKPENTFKSSNGITNEPENTYKINSGTKNKPENTKTNNSTNNEAENTSNINSGTKNKPEFTTTNNGTKNESKINRGTSNKPENTFKSSNGTTCEPENTSKLNSDPKNKTENTKANNSTNNKTENTKTNYESKINRGTLKQPENTFKSSNGTTNESENTSKINSGTKNNPENTKTNNSTNNEAENTSKINSGTKNKPEFTKTNNGTNNESKINRGTTNKPENIFKSSNDTTCEPKNISKIDSATNNKTENTKTNIESKINRGTVNKPENTFKSSNGTTNEPEYTSKINSGTKNKPEDTKTNNSTNNEAENTSKSNDSVAKKLKNDSNLTVEKPLAVLLEKRMKEYMHTDMKIIRLIHLGNYSKIFCCKDPNGRTYAAKVTLEQEKNHYLAGSKKERMLRMIQQDIPKENLNTVELIDGFGVERYWCFLTEYYPKTLKQVLKAQINMKPFHIDLVQDLARQLISAVMVLRNNGIVHSDIKPAHILMDSNHKRIKLCGFDAAYIPIKARLVPNIGTVNYRAPEIILGFSAGFSIDVWSSALVIHEMATNQILFNGVYNNDILFKQMSTFGNLPMDMIQASLFKYNHFTGRTFKRRVGVRGQGTVLFKKFYRTKRLQMSIMVAYNNHWATNDFYQRDSDMLKLGALHRLLEQMLLLDPRWRLAIEFVCADPFIYEMLV